MKGYKKSYIYLVASITLLLSVGTGTLGTVQGADLRESQLHSGMVNRFKSSETVSPQSRSEVNSNGMERSSQDLVKETKSQMSKVTTNSNIKEEARVLNEKEIALVNISKYTATGEQDLLKQAVMAGLDKGLTVNEIKDAMVQLYAYTGFPRSLNGLSVLMNTVKEREAKGLNTVEGAAATTTILEGQALAEGTKVQTELVGAEVKGALFDFAPAIEQYLKSHLFGDIFASNVLDWRNREIVTVAALEALSGVESQLGAHRQIAKHNGVSDGVLDEISTIVHTQGTMSQFAIGKSNDGYAQYFSGKSWLAPLNTEEVGIYNVTFEPASRNNWHIHHGAGQILVVVDGKGWYQAEGEPARALQTGDTVYIAPEVKHWHGATKDSYFSHLALSVNKDDVSVTWLEPVSDAQYMPLDWNEAIKGAVTE